MARSLRGLVVASAFLMAALACGAAEGAKFSGQTIKEFFTGKSW
jgi:hypothetical protein